MTRVSLYNKFGMLKFLIYILLLFIMAFAEGCGSGYEVKEYNGHIYIQRKNWWKKMLFGP